jgi:RNA polymerase sigma-70 factor (ECF subfamily)
MITTMLDRRSPGPLPEAAAGEDANLARERSAARGDRTALASLLREHARAIHDLCFHVAGSVDAADATQEALERVVTGIARFDPVRGSFRTWALGVARNVCRDRLRRRGFERTAFDDRADDEAERVASADPDPERMALARADARTLELALAGLPEPTRAAIVLFHIHEESYEEIAATLDVPIGTVMSWLHRGRRKLRDAIAAASGEQGGTP